MAEKTGFTGKLKYEFPTEAILEVQLKNDGWYRVTAGHFRSFDGPRRLTRVVQPVVGESFEEGDVKKTLYTYEGPLYLYNTNKEVAEKGSRTLIE